jgi:hypothetical protein
MERQWIHSFGEEDAWKMTTFKIKKLKVERYDDWFFVWLVVEIGSKSGPDPLVGNLHLDTAALQRKRV